VDPFANLSGRRLFVELKLILSEDDPLSILRRLGDFNLLRVIHPKLTLGPPREALFEEVAKVVAWHDLLFLEEAYERWLVYFLALIDELSGEEAKDLLLHLGLGPRRGEEMAVEHRAGLRVLRQLEGQAEMLPSEVFGLLSGLGVETLLWLMAKAHTEQARRAMSLYFTELKKVGLHVGGDDLINMGLSPGPLFKQILGSLFEARLNGLVKTREDEIEFVRHHYLREEPRPGGSP
jgi:tRNA nucleotidyltransferase (CCA-adding enzyme)